MVGKLVLDGKRSPEMVANVLQKIVEGRPPARSFHKEENVITFSVTSDGTKGEDWITILEEKECLLTDCAKRVLRSPDFKPTSGVTTEVAVLMGVLFKRDTDRTTGNIRTEAKHRNLTEPHPEVACLIRDKFTNNKINDMGLEWIVTMHDPVKDSDGSLCVLGTGYIKNDRNGLCAFGDVDFTIWNNAYGFAFAVSSASA